MVTFDLRLGGRKPAPDGDTPRPEITRPRAITHPGLPTVFLTKGPEAYRSAMGGLNYRPACLHAQETGNNQSTRSPSPWARGWPTDSSSTRHSRGVTKAHGRQDTRGGDRKYRSPGAGGREGKTERFSRVEWRDWRAETSDGVNVGNGKGPVPRSGPDFAQALNPRQGSRRAAIYPSPLWQRRSSNCWPRMSPPAIYDDQKVTFALAGMAECNQAASS